MNAILAVALALTVPPSRSAEFLPPPHFNAEVREALAQPCATVDRSATEEPEVFLRSLVVRGGAVAVDVRIGGFAPAAYPRFPTDRTGTLVLAIDSRPTVAISAFYSNLEPNMITFTNVSKGIHRLFYALRNVSGWDVAYGQACFKTG